MGGRGGKGVKERGQNIPLTFPFGWAKKRPGKKKTDGVIGRWITKTLRRPRSSRGKRLRRGLLLIPLLLQSLGFVASFVSLLSSGPFTNLAKKLMTPQPFCRQKKEVSEMT